MELLRNTTIIIIMLCLLVSTSKRRKGINKNTFPDPYVYNHFFVFSFIITLILVEGFRHGYSDTANYKGGYAALTDNLRILLNYSDAPGWDLIQWLLRRISKHRQFICIAMAVFFTVADVWFIREYSYDFPFSLYLYFLLSFIGSINALRQICAAVFLMFAFRWACDRKIIRYWLLILLLSTIHRSILILIPLSFVYTGKRWNFGLIAFEAFCIFSAVIPGPINALIGTLASDEYSHYLYAYTRGANILHVLVEAVPLIMGVIYHINNRENVGENRAIDVFINMQAISFGFMVLATRMAQYARIGMYMRNSTAILIPFLILHDFKGENKRIVKWVAIGSYLLEFALENYMTYMGGGFNLFFLDFSIFK